MIQDLSLTGYSLGVHAYQRPLMELRPRVTVKRIQEVVARYYGISFAHMTGDSKQWKHSHPRQVAMYLSREMLGRSTLDIARRFNRDHTTVLHAISKVAERKKRNEDLVEDIATLKALVRA